MPLPYCSSNTNTNVQPLAVLVEPCHLQERASCCDSHWPSGRCCVLTCVLLTHPLADCNLVEHCPALSACTALCLNLVETVILRTRQTMQSTIHCLLLTLPLTMPHVALPTAGDCCGPASYNSAGSHMRTC
jgi:hypothetical protein